MIDDDRFTHVCSDIENISKPVQQTFDDIKQEFPSRIARLTVRISGFACITATNVLVIARTASISSGDGTITYEIDAIAQNIEATKELMPTYLGVFGPMP